MSIDYTNFLFGLSTVRRPEAVYERDEALSFEQISVMDNVLMVKEWCGFLSSFQTMAFSRSVFMTPSLHRRIVINEFEKTTDRDVKWSCDPWEVNEGKRPRDVNKVMVLLLYSCR